MSFPGGTTVTQVWYGAVSGSGSSYAVRNLPGNGSIAPWVGSTAFGFLGGGTAAPPTLMCASP